MRITTFLSSFLPKKNPTSPSRFLLISAPLTLLVLVILVVAFQMNRQLYDQQQIVVGRLFHAASRHTAQLQREHLRLYSMIETGKTNIDTEALASQQDLVESRIRILRNTLLMSESEPEVNEFYDAYVAGWSTIKEQIAVWQREPNNLVLHVRLTQSMQEVELHVNNIATLLQITFEDSMLEWAEKSRFLNRLLTLGSSSFAVIILLMAYTSYLFIQAQAANEQTLRNSEQRLRAILSAIPDAVYRVSRDGICTDYKPAVSSAQLSPIASFQGKALADLLPTHVATLMQQGIDRALQNKTESYLEYVVEDAESAELRHYEARLLPSSNDEVQILIRDITTAKEQEEAALQAQKLESLGVLAGGIAHDFNNILTGIMAQASLAAAKIKRELPVGSHVQKVILSAERAADLTRQLLAYTGKGKFQVDFFDLNEVILDTTKLMGTALPGRATLDLRLQEDLPPVQVDRVQIQQVLMNLYINAIEALPDGNGTITFETLLQSVEDETTLTVQTRQQQTTTEGLAPGLYVAAKVTDTGAGMDQATLSRIFDPFFSTKPKGHGLGLSATIGIMRTHHGTLQVQSQLNSGTTFTLLLPAAHRPQPIPVPEVGSTWKKNPNGKKSILIIDDEAAIRDAATDILQEEGFEVAAAANGYEGIEIYRSQYQQTSVVLLDLKMPGINGKETYQELEKIQPDLKVIFTSGYSDSEVTALTSEFEGTTFLPKPYTAETLTKIIGQLL